MTSYVEGASGARRGVRAGGRSGRREARAARRPMAGGVVWIALLAALLGGVVAVNVVVLRLTLRLDRTGQQRVQLQADVARLQSELSSAVSSYRIEQQAQGKLGLVQADASTTTYVQLAPR